MAYLRGTLGSYQRWADVVGDQSYTFQNLLQYFIKSTHLTPPNLENAIPRMRLCCITHRYLITAKVARYRCLGAIGSVTSVQQSLGSHLLYKQLAFR
jgi:hypothetical protein